LKKPHEFTKEERVKSLNLAVEILNDANIYVDDKAPYFVRLLNTHK
jgi:hypothetical protein